MHTWLILIGLLVFLWLWFSSRGGATAQRGILSFGKSRAREVTSETVTFEDVAGVDEAKEELREVVDFLSNPERYLRIGARIPKGVLLVGPPGTGKTLLARAVAGEAKRPFYHLSGSDFVEMFVGVGAARVRDLFQKAREHAPCIVFIDEIDALGKARGAGLISHEEREQTLNQLLAEMDGFDPSTGVIIMAATNRPEILDTALLRPGRFDRQVLVDRPEKEGRRRILEIHVKNVTLAPDVQLEVVAGRTPGFAGADLANLVNEAALLAARARKPAVTMAEFDEAIERVLVGLEKKGRLVSPAERRIVAYHELGHAVVAELLPGSDPVQKVSIVPRGMGALGMTWHRLTEDRYLMTETELRHRIATLLGGRAAELTFIGEPSTGAQDDLAKATDIASDMVRRYGMSQLGLRTFERPRMALVNPDLPAATPREHGDETAASIDREVDRIIQEGLQLATAVLEEHRTVVEKLAQRLLEEQQLSGLEVRRALGLPEREGEQRQDSLGKSAPAAPKASISTESRLDGSSAEAPLEPRGTPEPESSH
jgi:cell division protease FtsH